MDDVVAELGVTPYTVYAWCVTHKVRDLFYRLEGADAVIAAKREETRAKRAGLRRDPIPDWG